MKVRAKELAQRLASDAEAICRMLLPNGKRDGSEWVVGSIAGEEGTSLKIHLTGSKVGVWCDFAAGAKGGDLLDLWAQTRRLSVSEAMREVKAHLGIPHAPKFVGSQSTVWRLPERLEVTAPRGKVLNYLTRERRLSQDAIAAYQLSATKGDDSVVFKFLRDGQLLNVKYLSLQRPGGKKQIRSEKDCEQCLFGWQAIPVDARRVAICEGELDAVSLWQIGHPALSVFGGAGNHGWLEQEYDNLDRFDVIDLCLDSDEAGEKGVLELAARLGHERCRIVRLPAKDANECLQKGLEAEAKKAFAEAASIDPAELRKASTYYSEILHDLYPAEGEERGFLTPFGIDGLRFRSGEMVVLNATNGHGKTTMIGHLALEVIRQGGRVCVASLEMRPGRWLGKMAKQAMAVSSPTQGAIKAVCDWWDGRMWVFDVIGATKAERMLEVFRYARRRYDCNVFVIDNLAMCGIAEDDFAGQKRLIESLCEFKNEMNVLVFLLTHPRKGVSEYQQNDKFDVKGSGAVTDLADTVLDLWRNKSKEDELAKREDKRDPKVAEMPDAILSCKKQRNGEWEKKCPLLYSRECHQYLRRGHRPRRYVEFSGAAETATSGYRRDDGDLDEEIAL
jgi:twinkle protein